jgi:hypothetical protein
MSRSKAAGARLTAVGPVTRLVRRRRSPSHAWRYRGVCSTCGPLGDGWTSEQTATEVSFAHARRHVEPEQLELELVIVDGSPRPRRKRRAA